MFFVSGPFTQDHRSVVYFVCSRHDNISISCRPQLENVEVGLVGSKNPPEGSRKDIKIALFGLENE